ncbi:MAG TPA: laccase domain-containing protein, partial [Alphaproteobacteria bacterium]|nr:laccase domain-containing protein [Alphaproteobacteria bacterium]
AMVTDVSGLALGVLTADCAPVLFYGKKSDGAPVVGAAHAGWGGALKGVLDNTLAMMLELGAVPESIRACIGPCIGQKSYEVRDDFADTFLEEDGRNEVFFTAGRCAGHLQFDLPGYCAAKLGRAGVKNVLIKDLDTYFNEEDFFSYRRATHRHEKDYGRQISVIMIQE